MGKTFLHAADVARKLCRSRSWFYANRTRLEARGFPPPVSVCGRLDGDKIDAWIEADGKLTASVRKLDKKRSLDEAFGLT
jgi:predicted DNA-binding transcriptional regulator AlpA